MSSRSSRSQCGAAPGAGGRRNAAQQFKDEQEADYVARERAERNPCKDVERHYKTYPKLREELSKRKSVSNIRPVSRRGAQRARRHGNGQKRLDYKRKIGEAQSSATKNNHLDKRSSRFIDIIYKNSKIHMKQTQTSMILATLDSIRKCRKGQNNRRSCFTGCQLRLGPSSSSTLSVKRKDSNADEDCSNYDVVNPDTREPSVSSYHSFGSATNENEPMG